MKCIYCSIRSKNGKKKSNKRVINLTFAKRGIDDYFKNNFFLKNEKKAIRIFAIGEPTLEFDTIKKIVTYARIKSNRKLFVEMQTNGYFNLRITKWIKKNIDLLWISLDGLKDIQDIHRPLKNGGSSFKKIENNIKEIVKSKKTKVGLRPTISKYNIYLQKKLIDYAYNNKIVAIYANPWDNVFEINRQPDFMKFAKEFLELWTYAKTKDIIYGNLMTVNFDEETEIYCRSCIPAPQFTPDGFVSSCDMVNNKNAFLAKVFPELIFGHYNKDEDKIIYNQDNIKKIKSRNIFNLKYCQKCPVLKHCAGGCLGLALSSSLNFYGINKKYCTLTRYLFNEMKTEINKGYNKNIPIHP